MGKQNVRDLRLRLGLSQERFAQLLGVSMQTVRRWEAGLTKPLPIISMRLEQLDRETSAVKKKEEVRQLGKSEGTISRGVGLEVGVGGLFKGIGSLFDLLSKMAIEGKQEYTNSGSIEGLGGKAKGVYGFSITTGIGGKPVVQQFGNIRESESGAVVSETREPLVDVFDEETHFVVVVELPGVEEKDIRLKVEGNKLDVSAAAGDRKYHREVDLPSDVEPAGFATSYKNGMLEIRLTKQRRNES